MEPIEQDVQPADAAGQWLTVDEGWGHAVTDFATLSEPGNVREYVAVHHRLGVAKGDRLLDLACGSGLACELAALLGAQVAGIDASPRLVAVARVRTPEADLRVGDMQALPWAAGSFDVVTSFRGIWGTTPGALGEALRVLAPGGRLGLTVWGHLKLSPGAWALAPFRLARDDKVRHQADMVALGRPGVGERMLAEVGFVDIERFDVPFAWEFPDAETYARALASTGPAFEAIQHVGEEAFHAAAVAEAQRRQVDGLPLRAEIAVTGFSARRPAEAEELAEHGLDRPVGFLGPPPGTAEAVQLARADRRELGFVMNATRLWAHHPDANAALFELAGAVVRHGGLSPLERAVLVSASAGALGDSYCSLAWGSRLAAATSPAVAAGVLRGDDEGLPANARALAGWARAVVRDPSATTARDVEALRVAGYDDAAIFAATAYVGLRVAFSTVNDALGARPDSDLLAGLPAEVVDAVSWGRPPEPPGVA